MPRPPHPLEQSQQDPARLDGVYSTMQMSIVTVLTHFPDEPLAHDAAAKSEVSWSDCRSETQTVIR